MANTTGSFQRRADDWDLQHRLADKELEQIDQQIAAADLRHTVAVQELANHDTQIENSRTVADFLQSKFTNQELYDWLLSQLSTTYFQAYQLAYDLAKRASKAYAYELGTDDPAFIQFGYWDSLRKGLSAGDKLMLDLRRMQAEFLKLNTREYEITKQVSLATIDPMALVKLRQTGECFIDLPEALFDFDYPGHYFRRIRNVSITLPCVSGPYTGVHATLTLLSHAVRRSDSAAGEYKAAVDGDGIPTDDPRFWKGNGAVRSIAVSHGQQDAGLFELNFHDERLLPFEGLGAISHWHLELPRDANAFDFSTISDLVIHLRYTARAGGTALRDAARAAIITPLPRTEVRVLSAAADFPDAWQTFSNPSGDGQRLTVTLEARHFPSIPTTQQLRITGIAALLLFRREQTYGEYNALGPSAMLDVHLGATPADGTIPPDQATFTPATQLGLIPQAVLATSGALGSWTVAFVESDLAKVPLLDDASDPAHHRVNRDVVQDVLLAFTYDVEEAS
jgi:Tc toxin complex TcA C-terminal TcB-binding domain